MIGHAQDLLDDLNEAKGETQLLRQWIKSKNGLPASLLVSGHHPLTLLHKALSEGLHGRLTRNVLQLPRIFAFSWQIARTD
jgi:hypothetical protein